MKTKAYEMFNIELYKAAAHSLIEYPIWKVLFAALISLFELPVEFVVGLPIFWLLDFWAGTSYAKRKANEEGKEKWFDQDKMRRQFGKITLHLGALIGIVVFANLFNVSILITIGFFYIIVHEFLFSTLPKFLGDEKASKLARYLKDAFLMHFGLDVIFKSSDKKK